MGMVKNTDPFSVDLTAEQLKKVKTLVRKECCNHSEGNCVLMDDGDEHSCPQLNNLHLTCTWFVEAVLPLHSGLCAEIYQHERVVKKCAVCGKEIQQASNRAKYCKKCVTVIKRKQHQIAQQKYRSK